MKNIKGLILAGISTVSFFLFPVSVQLPAETFDTSEVPVSDTNNYYLKIARRHIEQKEYAKAIDALELALLLEPGNKKILVLKKECMQMLKGDKQLSSQRNPYLETKRGVPQGHEGVPYLLKNAHTAIQERRFDDAVDITESVLKTDRFNEEALYIKEKANYLRHQGILKGLKIDHAQEKLKSLEYLREAGIPYQEIQRYPVRELWESISDRELPESKKIMEENKKKTEQLRLIPEREKITKSKIVEDALNTIISFEFIDTSLNDVVTFLREKANVNIVIDPVATDSHVTLKLKNVSLRTALNYILPKGYEYVIEGDIIHVYKQKMEMRVYDVRDILINMDDREPLKFDITAASNTQSGVSQRRGMSISREGTSRTKDTSERLLDLIEQIVSTIEPYSWSNRINVIGADRKRTFNIPGKGEGSIIGRMGQPGDLVVVNTKHVHEQIENLLASLRSSQNLQVSIEVRFVTLSDKFLEDIGSNISKFFSDNTSIDTGADTDISSLVSGSGLQINYSILSESMLKGFIRAIQEDKDSEILTSPRITLSNTQRGNIAVVRTINFVESTSVSEGIVTPVIGTIPEGTTFDVRPVVSADRKYVYLEVTPSVFKVEEIESFTFSKLTEDITVGGASQGTTIVPPEQTIQLPRINVSQVSVTVCVPDRGTLMIGGLGSIDKNAVTTGVPILSKLPILKRLFTRDQIDNKKSNLVILLKPTILIREEQETEFFKQMVPAHRNTKPAGM